MYKVIDLEMCIVVGQEIMGISTYWMIHAYTMMIMRGVYLYVSL